MLILLVLFVGLCQGHRDKGVMPMCIIKYPECNLVTRAALLRGKPLAPSVKLKFAQELQEYQGETSSYEAMKEYIVKFDIINLEKVEERLQYFASNELVMRPYKESEPDAMEFVLAGFARITSHGNAEQTIFSAGHPRAGMAKRYLIFGNFFVDRKIKTLKIQAMSYSRYRHLLKILKDCGAAQFLSAGCLEKAAQLQSIQTIDVSNLDTPKMSDTEEDDPSRSGWKELRKLHNSTRCSSCGGDNGGEKLLTCGRCKSRYYCSRACQKVDWGQSHKKDCGST